MNLPQNFHIPLPGYPGRLYIAVYNVQTYFFIFGNDDRPRNTFLCVTQVRAAFSFKDEPQFLKNRYLCPPISGLEFVGHVQQSANAGEHQSSGTLSLRVFYAQG